MKSMRKAAVRLGAALIVAVAGVVVTNGTSTADPAGHQVTYTVTAQQSLMADISYMNTDPPSAAFYNHDPSKYLHRVHAPISPGEPLVYTTTLTDPNQWELVIAGDADQLSPQARSRYGNEHFQCEIAVDGVTVVQHWGVSGVDCSSETSITGRWLRTVYP
jgi:hypothetical protein